MSQVKDLEPGVEALIRVVIVEQNPGQSLVYAEGVGESGLWSMVNSVKVEQVVGPRPSSLQLKAIRQLAARAKKTAVTGVGS